MTSLRTRFLIHALGYSLARCHTATPAHVAKSEDQKLANLCKQPVCYTHDTGRRSKGERKRNKRERYR